MELSIRSIQRRHLQDFCKRIESVLTIISLLIEADQSGTYRKIFGDFR
jgi:hypothetical protein